MKKHYKRDESFSKNSLCRELGEHAFVVNPALSTYRVCSRSLCHAAQRLQGGTWIDVVVPTKASVLQHEQLSMWGG